MIRWMAEHKVAANLLMIIILFAGAMGVKNIKQEVFPEMDLDFIIVAVPYSGATPDEVEESILLPIEDSLSGITGIKKVTGTAKESIGSLRIELQKDVDKDSVFDDIKSAVERLSTLPEEAEDPQIQLPRIRREVLNITIYGDGSQTRSFCYLDDMVDAFVRFMNTEPEIIGPINLGNPNECTILELAGKVIELTNSSSKIQHLPLPSDDPKQRQPDISQA